MRYSSSSSWLATCAIVVSVAVPTAAEAAGLGRMTVLSALGQPLNAEIELNATKDELSTMQVRIANADAYRRANLDYSAFVASVRLNIEQRRDGSMIVRASSPRAVNDPFIELMIEVIWASGRLMREYTSLIDPAGFTAADIVTPPVVPSAAAVRPTVIEPRTVADPLAPVPSIAVAPAIDTVQPEPAPKAPAGAPSKRDPVIASAGPAAGTDSYGPVRRGETLSRIAETVRPAGVSLDQMLVSLFRENKGAFDGSNMNRLRTGAVLRVPDAAAVGSTPGAEATREVRAQAVDFNAYRQRLAGAVQDAAPAAEGGQTAAGRIVPRVEDKAPAPASGSDVLRLSKGDTAQGGTGLDAKAAIAARQEDAIAREKTLREANERVASLEKMLKDAQRLLEIQSRQLAELQKKAEPAEPARPAETKPEPAKPDAVAPEGKPEPVPAPVPAETLPPVAAEPVPPVEQVAPSAEPPKPAIVPAAPAPQPGLLEQAIDFVTRYAVELGGGLLALLGLGWLLGRRKKVAKPVPAKAVVAKAPDPEPTMDAIPPSLSADSVADPMMATQVGLEEVDPLAEAEVYLTYGRDIQAEEILREAIARTPSRHELHLKLLEIYMKRADTGAFESVATQLFASTGGQGDDWLKAAEMGAAIDPANPLYDAGRISSDDPGDDSGDNGTPPGSRSAQAVSAGAAALAAAGVVSAFDTEKTQILTVDDTRPASTGPVDFDFEPVVTGAVTEAGADDEAVVDIGGTSDGKPALTATDMDFTLDFGTPETSSVPELPDFPLEPSMEGTATSEADLTFDPISTADANAGGLVEPLYQSQATNVLLDSGPPTGSILDFKFEAARAEAVEAAEMSGSGQPTLPPLGETMIMAPEGDLVTFDMTHPAGLPQNWQETTLPRVDLDLGDTNLDGHNPDKDEHWNDVNTKYDLAKAYEEMGDKDGAREILREVIAEGDDQQKTDAEAMLARLG